MVAGTSRWGTSFSTSADFRAVLSAAIGGSPGAWPRLGVVPNAVGDLSLFILDRPSSVAKFGADTDVPSNFDCRNKHRMQGL